MSPLLKEIDRYQHEEHDGEGGHHDQTDALDQVALVELVGPAQQRVVVGQLVVRRVTLLSPLLPGEY